MYSEYKIVLCSSCNWCEWHVAMEWVQANLKFNKGELRAILVQYCKSLHFRWACNRAVSITTCNSHKSQAVTLLHFEYASVNIHLPINLLFLVIKVYSFHTTTFFQSSVYLKPEKKVPFSGEASPDSLL